MKKALINFILAGVLLGTVQAAAASVRISVEAGSGHPGYHRPVYAHRYGPLRMVEVRLYPAYKRVHRPYYAKGYFSPRHRFNKAYAAAGCW